ncbi:hypothetical protein AVEN_88040-1 [Araneus ventricosus]|uniref:Uncharacterized protein n=1 Tax=Araneus ventricosus TaxID=182803 RepID=A0A4Y2L6V3_ARAVE|nr:hypothetical protein AVEN_88040-1 [Araneus ventricosus]
MLRKRSKAEKQLKLCCLQCVISRFRAFCVYGIMSLKKSTTILRINSEKFVIEMRSLKVFLKDKRNDLVEEELQFSKDTCEEMDIPRVKIRTVRRQKMMPREKTAD